MIFFAILSGIAVSILVPILQKFIGKDPGWLLALVPASLFAFFITHIPAVSNGNVILETIDWFPSLGIQFSFLLDGLSLTFSLIITLIGTLIFLYGSGYLDGHPKQARFYIVLLLFMSSMLGVVLSDNLITLFIFWELTSITSYILIGFNHEQERSRYFALQALLVTGGGGLVMLAGFILMGSAAGTFSVFEILNDPSALHQSGMLGIIAILVLAGAFTKSAQFPFHFWLPNAMVAPTPVSAYLHSATMVKAGVYLLARLNPTMMEWIWWSPILVGFGAVTMVFGGLWAIGQRDLKKILAYTTVSALGTLVFLTGLNNSSAYLAFGLFLVVHALYKGGLFLVAGAIDHSAGTRDITALRGLFTAMPVLGVAAVLSGLSNAGVPPFLGFLGKEGIYVATFNELSDPYLWGGLAILANACLVATALMVVVKPFWGKTLPPELHIHKPGWLLTGPALFLGLLSLVTGILPGMLEKWLLLPLAGSVSGTTGEVTLSAFKGDSIIFMISMATLAAGLAIYLLTPWANYYRCAIAFLGRFGSEKGYDITLSGMIGLAGLNSRILQSGSMRYYLTWILCTILFLVWYSMNHFGFDLPSISLSNVYFYDWLLAGLILIAMMLAIWVGTLLSTIVALGVVGYGIAIIFVFFGAPDLALTQFSIESLTIVIFILVASKLPAFKRMSTITARTMDKILAVAVGFTMAFLVLMVVDAPSVASISEFFMDKSYTEAKGRNVVNVILVDFRAIDTLGEIVVLAIAAIGIYTLLNIKIEDT